jgi:hypothetical protein
MSEFYKEGPVISVMYVRTTGGHFEEYMKYLKTGYKKLMDHLKSLGRCPPPVHMIDRRLTPGNPRAGDLDPGELLPTPSQLRFGRRPPGSGGDAPNRPTCPPLLGRVGSRLQSKIASTFSRVALFAVLSVTRRPINGRWLFSEPVNVSNHIV